MERLENFTNDHGIVCKNEEEAIQMCAIFDDYNFRWKGSGSAFFSQNTRWCRHTKIMVYFPTEGSYTSDYQWCINNGYIIYAAEDYLKNQSLINEIFQ